jgi:hypothetical protein
MITLCEYDSIKNFEITSNEVTQNSINVQMQRRSMRFQGSSFILDIQNSELNEPLSELQTDVSKCFKGAFVKANFLHSTILSHKLDQKDLPSDYEEAKKISALTFRSDGIQSLENYFKNRAFQMCITGAHFAENVNLIFKNQNELPDLKRHISNLGAMIKPTTMDGAKIATTAIVLGWFKELVSNQSLLLGKQRLMKFHETMIGKAIHVRGFYLVHYDDVNLESHKILYKFQA